MSAAARVPRKIAPYHLFLTPWEAVQLDCMAAARAGIVSSDRLRARGGNRRDDLSKLFTKRMSAIRNRARQRERIARGVHGSMKRRAA